MLGAATPAGAVLGAFALPHVAAAGADAGAASFLDGASLERRDLLV